MSKEESGHPTPPAKPASTSPPAAKPAATAAKPAGSGSKTVPRRSFLSWMTLAWTAFTASMLATLTATARFMFPNVLFEPPPTFKAGFPSEIQMGQVDERFGEDLGGVHDFRRAANPVPISDHPAALPHTRGRAPGAPSPGRPRRTCAGESRAAPACARGQR